MNGTWASILLEFLTAMLRRVPAGVRHRLLKSMGGLFGWFPSAARRAVEANYRLLLGLPESAASKLATSIFQNFAVTLFDFFSPQGIKVEIPRKEHLEAWQMRHGKLLLLTFHMGLWEMGARILGKWGWPITAVYQPYTNPHMRRSIEKRRAPGVHYIPVGSGAARAVVRALKRGECVAMLGDHIYGEGGIAINLMGHPVKWAKGPILFAVKENAPIVVAVVIRTGIRAYRIILEDPLIPQEKSMVEVRKLAQAVANKFGNLLKMHPTQWYFFQPLSLASSEDQSSEIGGNQKGLEYSASRETIGA